MVASGEGGLAAAAAVAAHAATTAEVRALCADLQVLGRSEFKQLLKWCARAGARPCLPVLCVCAVWFRHTSPYMSRVQVLGRSEFKQLLKWCARAGSCYAACLFFECAVWSSAHSRCMSEGSDVVSPCFTLCLHLNIAG